MKLLLHFNQYALNMTSGFGWFLLRIRRKIHSEKSTLGRLLQKLMMYIKGLDFLNQVGSNLVSAGLSKQVEFTISFQQRFCLTDIETGHEKYKDRKCKKRIGLATHRKSGSWSPQTCKFREHQKLMNPYYIGDSPWESTWYFPGTLHEIQTFGDQNWGLVFRNFLHLSHPEICLEETMFERFLCRILCIFFFLQKTLGFKDLSCICCDIFVKLLLFDSPLRRVLGSLGGGRSTKGRTSVRKSRLFQSCRALKHYNHLSGIHEGLRKPAIFSETTDRPMFGNRLNQSVIWVDHEIPFDDLRSPAAFRRSEWLLSFPKGWGGPLNMAILFMKWPHVFRSYVSAIPIGWQSLVH